MRRSGLFSRRAPGVVSAALSLAVSAFASLGAQTAARPCCFDNPQYSGTCVVQPAEGESCASILEYLNNPQAHGKSYCGNTTIRGGWKQVECAAPPDAAGQALARALDRALEDGWGELHVESACRSQGVLSSVELFGNGVGIWDGEAQFRLPPESVRTLLQAFRDADFAGMRESYGGKGDPVVPTQQAPRLACRVGLGIDGLRKRVAQLEGGRRSEALERLANRVLEECRDTARTGVRAADLADGLDKLARGELAAEAFHLLVNRREDPGAGGAGWLLRIDGRRAALSPRTVAGHAGARVVELPHEELARVARLLSASDLIGLPGNLYAELYTDVTVAVLRHRKQVQARRFAGMQPSTHGDGQRRFDALLEQLGELKRQVAGESRPESTS